MQKVTTLGWKFWLVEVFMTALVAYNFWLAAQFWGIGAGDPTVVAGAIILAGSTEIALDVFLHLMRSKVYAEQKNGWAIALWVGLSAGCIGISIYVNHLYFATVGYHPAGNQDVALWIRSLWPMILLVGAALVPPKVLIVRSLTEINAEYDSKLLEEQRRQELATVKARGQHKRLGILFGAEAREQERQAHQQRRKEREERRLKQERLRLRGRELGLLTGEEGFIDYERLEDQIRLREGPLPGQIEEAKPTARKRRAPRAAKGPTAPTATPGQMSLNSDFYTAADLVKLTGWKKRTVYHRMEPDYQGTWKIKVSRKTLSDGTKLVALKDVAALMAKLSADPSGGASDPQLAAVTVPPDGQEILPEASIVSASFHSDTGADEDEDDEN